MTHADRDHTKIDHPAPDADRVNTYAEALGRALKDYIWNSTATGGFWVDFAPRALIALADREQATLLAKIAELEARKAVEFRERAEAAERALAQHELANGGCVPKPAYDDLARALAAERATVLGIAQRHATGAHARGDSEERRRWLDLCIVLERAALAGPAEPEPEASEMGGDA